MFFFKRKVWRTSVIFVGLLISLFWTSGDVCPEFQNQCGPLAWMLPRIELRVKLQSTKHQLTKYHLPICVLHSIVLLSSDNLLTAHWSVISSSKSTLPRWKKQHLEISYGTPGRPGPGSCPEHVKSNQSSLVVYNIRNSKKIALFPKTNLKFMFFGWYCDGILDFPDRVI